MPRKLKLDIDFSSDISLIAISCHKRDFWLAMQLNEVLKFDFRRMGDLPYFHPSLKEILTYVLFYYADDNSGMCYFLVGNYNPDGKLFPEYRAADYFILVNDTMSHEQMSKIIIDAKSIKGVLTAFQTDREKLKDLKNFISDLELHMIDQLKTKKN